MLPSGEQVTATLLDFRIRLQAEDDRVGDDDGEDEAGEERRLDDSPEPVRVRRSAHIVNSPVRVG
jgi:hypothetical protein